jgi:hypothetical protein
MPKSSGAGFTIGPAHGWLYVHTQQQSEVIIASIPFMTTKNTIIPINLQYN